MSGPGRITFNLTSTLTLTLNVVLYSKKAPVFFGKESFLFAMTSGFTHLPKP